jgi:hypothetical protein
VPYTEAMGAPPWAASLDQAGILQQPNRDDLKSPLKRFQSSTKHFAVAGGEHEQNSRLLNSPPDARRGAAAWHFPVPLPTSRGNHFRAFFGPYTLWTVVLRVRRVLVVGQTLATKTTLRADIDRATRATGECAPSSLPTLLRPTSWRRAPCVGFGRDVTNDPSGDGGNGSSMDCWPPRARWKSVRLLG